VRQEQKADARERGASGPAGLLAFADMTGAAAKDLQQLSPATPKARGAHWRCRRLGGQTGPERPARPKAKPPLYDHWCPVCQSSRTGRRPVKAWRCAACVAAGLDGKLEITRRARGPKGAR
jgi:hypothetical protein